MYRGVVKGEGSGERRGEPCKVMGAVKGEGSGERTEEG